MSLRGLILDLDGTLVDSNPAHVEAWRRAFEELGYSVPAISIAPLIGMSGDKLVPAAVGEAAEWRHGDELRAGQAKHYADVVAEQPPRVFPGAVELLRDAGRVGLKTALATSSKREHLDVTFAACGHDFSDDVDKLVTADDADESKPEPDLTHAAAGKLGLPPGECVLIGDTTYDGQAATTAGALFWGVETGGYEAGDLWAVGADRVFPDVAALWRHLDDVIAPTACVQPAMRAVG